MTLGKASGPWSVALVAVLAALLGVGSPAPAQGYGAGRLYFDFQDPRIVESSGLVASSVRDGVFFTHNDSPGTPEGQVEEARVFAVDDQGCTLAEYRLPGATNQDWEDIARGPSAAGGNVLWLGDIGDNNHMRTAGIDVYRVAEPNMNSSARRAADGCPTAAVETTAWTKFRLRYVDTPHDAETLLAHPSTGQLFVVTKSPTSTALVYAAPVELVEGVDNMLMPVAAITFPPSTTLGRGVQADQQFGFDAAGRLQTTAGDISADGTRVVIRTYTDAWEWDITGGDVPGAFLGVPRQLPLRYTAQGEAIAYTRDGAALVTTCERLDRICEGAHIYEG